VANQEPFSLVRNFDPAAAIRVFTIVDVATITSAQSDSGIDARVTDVSSNPLVSLTGTIPVQECDTSDGKICCRRYPDWHTLDRYQTTASESGKIIERNGRREETRTPDLPCQVRGQRAVARNSVVKL
jgi:hypothetical protein